LVLGISIKIPRDIPATVLELTCSKRLRILSNGKRTSLVVFQLMLGQLCLLRVIVSDMKKE
jgi:hypothetical protein